MKVTYTRVSGDGGPFEAMEIEGETDFEREWLRIHNFPKMHDGKPVLTEKKNANN